MNRYPDVSPIKNITLRTPSIGRSIKRIRFSGNPTVAFGVAPGPQQLLRGSGDGLGLAAVECTNRAVRSLVFVFAFVFAFGFTSVFAVIFI